MISDYQRLMRSWHEREVSGTGVQHAVADTDSRRVDDQFEKAFARVQSSLIADLLSQIHIREPQFFEKLVIDVLLAMGYGGRRRDLARRLGRSGDGGVDGMIAQDELGLDPIYLQAKRLKPGAVVPISEVRDFAGSLDARHANKGIFLTTSHFAPSAVAFCEQVSRRVALVDGKQFAELMIRFNIGVTVRHSYQIKQLDPGYFRGSAPL